MRKRSILLCDIDGVVCDSSRRLALYSDNAALERGDYNSFRASMHAYNTAPLDIDVPIREGVSLLHGLMESYCPDEVVFLTSRGEEGRVNTFAWLREFVYPDLVEESLLMRPAHEERSPGVFWEEGEPRFCHISHKRDKTLKLMETRRVLMALDDHLPICQMYQSIGVPALNVLFPDVDCLSLAGMNSVPVVNSVVV